MTFRSKVLARTKKYDGQTDRRTDGHPKPIGPQPFGLGPNNHYPVSGYLLSIVYIYLDGNLVASLTTSLAAYPGPAVVFPYHYGLLFH